MIYMGFNNALKNWKKIVIAAIELAAFLVIMIVAISTYYKQSEMYRPYKELLESKGVQFCTITRKYKTYGDGESNLSSLAENLDEVDEIFYSINQHVRIDGVYDGFVIGLDSMMSEYEPEMAEGVWINDAEERDCINVAVTENSSGVKCGEYIDLVVVGADVISVKAYVCGIVKNGTKVFDGSVGTTEATIDELHVTYDSSTNLDDEYYAKIFMGKAEYEQAFDGALVCDSMFIKYNDDITTEEELANEEYLTQNGMINRFEDIKEKSESKIKDDLMSIIPVLIGMLFFTSISFAASGAISTMNELETYAIFFVTGMKWTGVVVIKLVEGVVTGVLGISIFITVSNIFTGSRLRNVVEYEFYPIEILAVAGVVTYFLIIQILIPYACTKKKRCVDIIREVKI